ncbi:MAG: hypothetical protein PUD20_09440 [bacterium]|nr:hypothetical protein [bacterium]
MRKLWEKIESKGFSKEDTRRLFLLLNSMKFSLCGFAVWLLVSRFALGTIEWAICFIGYSGFFIGYLGGFLYLCKESK